MQQGRVTAGRDPDKPIGPVDRLARRRFLQRAAIGGAVAWTAPVLHQIPVGAQVSPGGGPTTTTTSTTLPPSAPVLLGRHSFAALQPTAWGRRLQEMAIFDGIVFVGYGDWNSNTGPIRAGGWDIAGAAMVYESALATENTWVHRVVNNRLVIPFIDPDGTNVGDLATRPAAPNTWTTLPIDTTPPIGAASYHCFDAASFDGTDLWVCGARIGSPDAVVWRSPSGIGGDWVEMLSYTPPIKPAPINFARFNTLTMYNGLLYVGGYYFFDNVTPIVVLPGQAWNGSGWIAAPEYTLVAGVHRPGHRPLPFDGKDVRLYAWPTAAYPMLFFDGTSITVGPQTAFHHNIDDQPSPRLWWINSLGEIYKQNPGGSPVFVVNAPAGASCLAVQGTDLYIGTAASDIWRVTNV